MTQEGTKALEPLQNKENVHKKEAVEEKKERSTMPPTLQRQVERGLQKEWHQALFAPFSKAVKSYQLIQEGDRIAVCISGGKDSMLMAKLFQEIQRHGRSHFELVFLVMDPGYKEENRQRILDNAALLGIPLTIFETSIFDTVYHRIKSPCYQCARMRRGFLYSKAQELGCNKIALGHHYDDVIETVLMSMLYTGQIQSMRPKLHSTHFPGMELIRPLYLVREEAIKAWRDQYDLSFLQCACRFTERCAQEAAEQGTLEEGAMLSKRQETKELIRRIKAVNPFVESNIFKSMENVHLDTVLGYKQGGIKHAFLEDYDRERQELE